MKSIEKYYVNKYCEYNLSYFRGYDWVQGDQY